MMLYCAILYFVVLLITVNEQFQQKQNCKSQSSFVYFISVPPKYLFKYTFSACVTKLVKKDGISRYSETDYKLNTA